MTYMDKIFTLSLEKPISYFWRIYDENFRRMRALLPKRAEDMPWHITLEQVLRESREAAATNKLSAGNGFRQFYNSPNSNNNRNGNSNVQASNNTCNDYNNKDKGCTRNVCRYVHRCKKCNRMNHPAFRCRVAATNTTPSPQQSA